MLFKTAFALALLQLTVRLSATFGHDEATTDYSILRRGIQYIDDCDQDALRRKTEAVVEPGEATEVRSIGEGESNGGSVRGRLLQDENATRCARTLGQSNGHVTVLKAQYIPPITYTFWKCGVAIRSDPSGCTCDIARTVTAPADQAVAMTTDEYLSQAACNRNCKRGAEDKCWTCASSTSGNGYTHYWCAHVADLPSFYLGDSLKTEEDCNDFGVCPKIKELKGLYEYDVAIPSF